MSPSARQRCMLNAAAVVYVIFIMLRFTIKDGALSDEQRKDTFLSSIAEYPSVGAMGPVCLAVYGIVKCQVDKDEYTYATDLMAAIAGGVGVVYLYNGLMNMEVHTEADEDIDESSSLEKWTAIVAIIISIGLFVYGLVDFVRASKRKVHAGQEHYSRDSSLLGAAAAAAAHRT